MATSRKVGFASIVVGPNATKNENRLGLKPVEFTFAYLQDTSFVNANLEGANLQYPMSRWRGPVGKVSAMHSRTIYTESI